jgi:hypothetical protein
MVIHICDAIRSILARIIVILAAGCVSLGMKMPRVQLEVRSICLGYVSHFDMDEACCARMRSAMAAGLESASTGASPRQELNTPDTSPRIDR